MLEDQVAYLLQRYLGNYVRGLNKEALKISVWQGDVELTNMQLKPEALNALKLPVKVKAGFLGSVKLKVPWSRLGQDPVLVHLDRIFLLAEPATQVEGSSEDAIQEVKRTRIREIETKLVESQQMMKTEINKSWIGSLINTVIGNLRLSISNIHIRYEDIESNPGHPFAAGMTLDKLSAFTVDDKGEEAFVTGGALERIQKRVELERMAIYFNSDITPWHVSKPWEDLLPSEWSQIFKFGTVDGKPASGTMEHTYILQPVSGNAMYSKLRSDESKRKGQPVQTALVNLDDVTLCLSKNGYRDVLKLADNFAAFNQRLKFAHYRPRVSVKADPRSWWKYATKAVSDQQKKASGKMSWEQVLRYANLRKKYISLYAGLLKSDRERVVVDHNEDIEELDRGLDIEVILQWRMLAHKFVEQTASAVYLQKQKTKKSWFPFGWSNQHAKDDNEPGTLTEDDWNRLNSIIGYKEDGDEDLLSLDKGDYVLLKLHMRHNATKLMDSHSFLADLSCDNLACSIKLYSEAKVVDINLGSYRLLSPNGILAESESASDSLVGVFCYKPLDANVDWSVVARASPCYVTYLKDSVDDIVDFFQSSGAVSQTLARETASAVQTTIDEVKRTAAKQMNRALKDRTRFLLDLDIAAPKITIPTDFYPDGLHPTKLLIDLGKLVIRSQDNRDCDSPEEINMYSQFDLILRDVFAFLVDGDYSWSNTSPNKAKGPSSSSFISFLPVIDKCGAYLKLQQIRSPVASLPSTRLAVRLPSLNFHFSPSRYHRLLQIAKIFQGNDANQTDLSRPWDQADFSGWLFILARKGVGGREAIWQRRYFCIVGQYIYVLENPESKNYKHYYSLRGKQLYQVPSSLLGDADNVLSVYDAERSSSKVLEDTNALLLRFDSEDSRKTWQSYLQGAIYFASATSPLTGLMESSSDSEDSEKDYHDKEGLSMMEDIYLSGVLDELKISFSYSVLAYKHDQSLMKLLLAEERPLLEFRAIGGQVELSIRASDIFLGTILKALEIEDLILRNSTSQLRYLARSFIRNAEAPLLLDSSDNSNQRSNDLSQSEGDDEFYEAPENLNNLGSSPMSAGQEHMSSQSLFESESSDFKSLSFKRISGLLPFEGTDLEAGQMVNIDAVDSFVKAQIVILNQNSPLYSNVDIKVAVTLSTLSFYCRRPSILAIMEFVNAINAKDEQSSEAFTDATSADGAMQNTSGEITSGDLPASPLEEPVAKSFLGKGKSRVIFHLVLNMDRAEIFIVKEDDSKISTLAQNNLLTDIKVFPSSFSIRASLGNLKISDDSLPSSHMYYWVCDMRNVGGKSFVELEFCSYHADDEDYKGYDYSLVGQLSEVQIVYLNRFIQEIASYFMGLVPSNPKDFIQIKDQMTNTEKWLTITEIEGSPAIKFDLSLKKPIILMPQRTSSSNYLKLDVVQITVRNHFRWFGGDKSDINAVHVDILDILVDSINLNIGSGTDLGENIIQDIKGISIVLQRSLRDLSHQIPSIEVSVAIEELKAALSNKEYDIITECAQSNISETPNIVPPLGDANLPLSTHVVEEGSESLVPARSENEGSEIWQQTKVSLRINMVELSLHYGVSRDSPLATLQVSGVWLLYKSNSLSEGFLSATLKGLIVVDDREGTEKELRLAIGKPDIYEHNPPESVPEITDNNIVQSKPSGDSVGKYDLPILILDANFRDDSTFVSLRIQRPQLLVALDFLIAIVEFFVPTVRNNFSNEDNPNSSPFLEALILDQPIYRQTTAEFSLSPQKPLVADDERFDHFVYDGQGGSLYVKDRQGLTLSSPSREALVYVGNGKTLQFKNVTFMGGSYLDSCVSLGANGSYSASENDSVFLTGEDDCHSDISSGRNNTIPSKSSGTGSSSELIFELQVISPELTFYNKSRHAGQAFLANKLLHAQMDAFCRLVSKGNIIEVSAETLGFMVESNGIKILEPFDASATLTRSSEKTSIQLSVSDIFMNFSFSILRLFLSVEEEILSFLRTRSQTTTISCFEFDKVATIKHTISGQVYTFWRPRAPTGFAVLGDYLTPIDKPPTKGVIAVNSSLIRVKRPKSFTLVFPVSSNDGVVPADDQSEGDVACSIWFPEAPKGYVALGCVASPGKSPPPISSFFCILSSLVSPCGLRDCINLESSSRNPNVTFWRVDNASGTFLPADLASLAPSQKAYELRHLYFGFREVASGDLKALENQSSSSNGNDTVESERNSAVSSRRRVGMVATFRLIWWNQGSGSRKRLSIWRPVVPEGMVYFGDIAVQGYEPPNTCMAVEDSEDMFRAPSDFQLVGHIKRHRKTDYMSFWMPQAPPGFVSLGCVASKGSPKQSDFISLRCIRSDMVSTDQFLDASIWDTSETRFIKDPFSVWVVGNELDTFIVWNGYKKPPRRFAFKFIGTDTSNGSDDTLVDAEIRTFSATLFDDYGGLMVPLCNISVSGIWFSLHGRPDSLNSNVTFSLTARSFNDKYESWEPLIELVDGSLRYESNPNAPGVASQLRITSTTDLNLNVSVSNANMILQAYASWNKLGHVDDSKGESPSTGGRSMISVHQKKNYYIVPQNKLGQDVFIRIFGDQGQPGIVKFSAGDKKSLKLSIPKNMLDSHLKGSQLVKRRLMVSVIIAEAEFPKLEGLSSQQYSVGIRIYNDDSDANKTYLNQQTARTSGINPGVSQSSDSEYIKWNEVFYFKVDSVDNYRLEFTLTETGNDKIVGYHSSTLNNLGELVENLDSNSDANQFMWLELSSRESELDPESRYFGRIRCALFLPPRSESGKFKKPSNRFGKHGSIQISPTKDGPWTTLRLNYGAPVACLKLGNNDVVASEVSVTDGNRYVSVRSLVSVHNSTNVTLELCLSSRPSNGNLNPVNGQRGDPPLSGSELTTNELFESNKYNASDGWVPCNRLKEEMSGVQLPPGWEWIDEWHVDDPPDKGSADGWVYLTDNARQRRWIRNRKRVARDVRSQITVAQIRPGEHVPLPLPYLAKSSFYALQLKPSDTNQYSWSCAMDKSADTTDVEKSKSETYISDLTESEELVFCAELSESSSSGTRGLWFCLSIQGTEIGKDVHFNPIKDWNIVVRPPVSIANYLPVVAEISLLEMQASGHFSSCYKGMFGPGDNVKIYAADIRNPLYCSLLPRRGWLPLHEAVLISHPHNPPAKTISLRSAVSGRVVQIILEHNHTNERLLQPKLVKVYSPYWFGVARCPPLCFRLTDMNAKRSKKNPFSLKNKKKDGVILEEITEEEIRDGYTIASALNFKSLGLSAAVAISREEQFGPIKDLSPLGDMDGSLDLFAYDAEGNCLQLFVSSKPCPYQSVPTKVIFIRPFMTFTNRVGENMLLKFSSEDEPKALRVSDTRVSFVRRKLDKPDELQVKLNDTDWSFPIRIVKEDTITLVLRRNDGTRRFLRTEIRGYEEGSRFIVVFRLGSTHGPIRIENRTISSVVRFRQVGFGDDACIQLQPLSTVNFSWEDPYGQKIIDTEVFSGNNTSSHQLDLDKAGFSSIDSNTGLFLHVATSGKTKVVRFLDQYSLMSRSKEGSGTIALGGNWGDYTVQAETSDKGSPLELILDLGVLGVSVVDHKPRELAYLYMEKFFISYSTGYDGGTTSRFKLILGYLQLDNQLPLTVMPVLLAPEQTPDAHHPVFKMTVTMRNENLDGLQIYPYVYIRVTDKSWRLSIHEPVIWALVDFFNSLQLGRVPTDSTVTQVDPEIRVDLIDISEVRLRVSLETAPAERPHGLLGVWGPVLSAVGNAFKIQIHLRKVTHRDRFLRRSSVTSAIGNRLWRDLIHNPLHLLFSVDVLGMASSTLASLGKGFAELSTDGQFLQLRSKQVWSRRITGVGDGIVQGTEALAQGFAFGVTGVVRKPMESARQNGLLGLVHGLGQACLGFVVQPVSGALDFFSLTVDGIGASCSRCLEILSKKKHSHRIRNPRAFHADNVLREYSEREAVGQMILFLAEASRNFGCTEIFKEPSKFAWTDCYEEHFVVPYQRIVLVTNRRVVLLQCVAPDKMDSKPCKIMWDVPWQEVLSLELAKSGYARPSHLIIHLKSFKRGENFVRVIKCNTEQLPEETVPQAVKICSAVRSMWKAYQNDMKQIIMQVPSSQGHLSPVWSENDSRESHKKYRTIITSMDISTSSSSSISEEQRFCIHSINFSRIWSSERESKGRCVLCRNQNSDKDEQCSIWRPVCPDGYISIGDIARPGSHPPNVAAVYRYSNELFTVPVGYDLVWRNCTDDYKSAVSIWYPRAPQGYVSLGCVVVPNFEEPKPDAIYCVKETLSEETAFEGQKIWSSPDSYPWACYIYQSRSEALQFVALRQPREDSDHRPKRVADNNNNNNNHNNNTDSVGHTSNAQ